VALPIIRTSDRGYFKRCRQLWDFTSKIRQNYEPVQRYPAFDFGTAIHRGLEVYYDPATWGDLPTMRENAREAFLASIRELHQKVMVGALDFEMRFDEEEELGQQMLDHYFIWAPKHDEFKPVFREIEFEVESTYLHSIVGLNGVPLVQPIPFLYQGRIDLIIEDEYGYWIVDHKTAAQFGDVQWLWLDDQCSSYAWAVQKMLGLQIRGVIYNQLRKSPPHPPKQLKYGGFSRAKNQDTSFEVYLKTLRQHGIDPHHYRDFLLYLKENPKEYIRRTKVTYTQQTLELVGQRIQREAREMLESPVIYPTPSQWNCNGCRFFAPCVALHEGRDSSILLAENYEVRA
jgi:hypothetical protein